MEMDRRLTCSFRESSHIAEGIPSQKRLGSLHHFLMGALLPGFVHPKSLRAEPVYIGEPSLNQKSLLQSTRLPGYLCRFRPQILGMEKGNHASLFSGGKRLIPLQHTTGFPLE